jgi:hypothetical protein
MKKGDFDDILSINFTYERGFKFGYLAAKLGVNWPDIPEDERKACEDEAKEPLNLLTENCEKGH